MNHSIADVEATAENFPNLVVDNSQKGKGMATIFAMLGESGELVAKYRRLLTDQR